VGSLRVATYNLDWVKNCGEKALDVIKASKADILFLQETTLQSESFLQPQLKASHPYFHAQGHDGQYYAERFAFASRFPLRDITFTPPDQGLFGFLSATC